MATFTTFEDIEAWQRGRQLVKEIYSLTLRPNFSKDFALRDQIRRSAISIISNIAEGFGRGGKLEFMQFLSIAKGSLAELRAQLYIALDLKYIEKEDFTRLNGLADETGKLLAGLMNYLRTTTIKGTKYKCKPSTEN